ncbi:Putative conserved plasma membrane protein, partial [Gryllus bimaculatus]
QSRGVDSDPVWRHVGLCGAGGARGDRPTEVAPGCHRKGHKVTCRAWAGPDAPDIPHGSAWSDFWALDLSDVDAAKRIDLRLRGATCHVKSDEWAWRGLGTNLGDGRLPARWLGARYRGLIVLYMRGLGLRSVQRDAFELLTVVQHVYLSSNRLGALDPDMWQHNTRLTGVSLENNVGLQLAEGQPLFRSDVIEYLDLSGCGLRALPEAAFRELPRLQLLQLERNCFKAVPAPALALVADLWSVALSENAIESLSADDASLLARLPEALFFSMADLVCLWPPEDHGQSWEKVLARDSCRTFDDALENATHWDGDGDAAAHAPSSSTESGAEAGAGAPAAHCQLPVCGGGGGDASLCKWLSGGTLLVLALGLVAFTVAVFTDRVAVTLSVAGGARRRAACARSDASLSRANLTDPALEDDVEDGGARPQPWDVVRFGRGK